MTTKNLSILIMFSLSAVLSIGLIPLGALAAAEAVCPVEPDGALEHVLWSELVYMTLGKEVVRHKFTGYISSDTIAVETSIPIVENTIIVGYDTYTQHIHLGSRQVVWTSKPIDTHSTPGVVKQSDYTDLFVPLHLAVNDRLRILNEDVFVIQENQLVHFIGNNTEVQFGSRMYQKETGVLQGFNVPVPAPSLQDIILCGSSGPSEPEEKGDVILKDGFITSTPYFLSQRAVLHGIFTTPNPPSEPVLLDLELYNEGNQKIAQNWFDDVTIPDERDVDKTLDVPLFLPEGTYTFKAGVFTPDWNSLIHWYDNVETFPLVGLGQYEDGVVVMVFSSANPSAVPAGQSSTLLASFMSPNTQNHALIDLELYDGAGNRVAQQFYDNAAFPRSGTGNFEGIYTLQSPVSLPKGVYTFKVGIFTPGWGSIINWYDNAGTLTVQ